MGCHNIGNLNFSPEQITSLLYNYMVDGQSAAYSMKNSLGMSTEQIGDTRQAWRKIERIYRSFGFPKTYRSGNSTPYQAIGYSKLESYVNLYWSRNAREADLIAYFPEIAQALAWAKEEEKNKPHSGTASGTRRKSNYNPDAAYQSRRQTNSGSYYVPQMDEEEYEEDYPDYYEENYPHQSFDMNNLADGIGGFVSSFVDSVSNGVANSGSRRRSGGQSGGQFKFNKSDKKSIIIAVAVILAIIFRKKIFELIIRFLPVIVAAALIYVIYRLIRNGSFSAGTKRRSSGRKSSQQVHFDSSGLLPAAIFWIIGFGGFANGAGSSLGSTVFGIILIGLGIACVIRKK